MNWLPIREMTIFQTTNLSLLTLIFKRHYKNLTGFFSMLPVAEYSQVPDVEEQGKATCSLAEVAISSHK